MMTEMHQPTKLEFSQIKEMEKKGQQVISQMNNINELEKELEIQDEDKELSMITKKINDNLAKTQ